MSCFSVEWHGALMRTFPEKESFRASSKESVKEAAYCPYDSVSPGDPGCAEYCSPFRVAAERIAKVFAVVPASRVHLRFEVAASGANASRPEPSRRVLFRRVARTKRQTIYASGRPRGLFLRARERSGRHRASYAPGRGNSGLAAHQCGEAEELRRLAVLCHPCHLRVLCVFLHGHSGGA